MLSLVYSWYVFVVALEKSEEIIEKSKKRQDSEEEEEPVKSKSVKRGKMPLDDRNKYPKETYVF